MVFYISATLLHRITNHSHNSIMQGCVHVLRPLVIGKVHRQLFIKSTYHSDIIFLCRGVTEWFIGNLAVADILLASIAIPLPLHQALQRTQGSREFTGSKYPTN